MARTRTLTLGNCRNILEVFHVSLLELCRKHLRDFRKQERLLPDYIAKEMEGKIKAMGLCEKIISCRGVRQVG